MAVHVEVRGIGLAFGLQQFSRILHERDAELMRPRGHRNPNLQVLVDQLIVLVPGGWRHGEGLDLLAIQEEFELVRFVQALDLLVAIARQPDLYFVLRILGKEVRNQRASTRSQRQPFHVFLLREVRPNPERVDTVRTRCPDRQPADLLRG